MRKKGTPEQRRALARRLRHYRTQIQIYRRAAKESPSCQQFGDALRLARAQFEATWYTGWELHILRTPCGMRSVYR